MTDNESARHRQEPAEDADPAAGADRTENARTKKPLDEEVRDWDIDITQSEGPVLEEGDDLDTGAGIHRPRP